MRKITLLSFVFLLPACGIFKKVSKATFEQKLQTGERLDVKEVEQLHVQKQESLLLLNKTVSGLEYRLEIWPKGSFTFSPEKGFVGEAERLLYKEQGFNRAAALSSHSLKQDSMRSQQKVIRQRAKQELAVKEMHKVTQPVALVYLIVALLLVLLAAGFWFRRKFSP
jgi:hypothetical protein